MMTERGHKFRPGRFYRINIIFLIPLIVCLILVFLLLTCSVREVTVNGNSLISDSEIENYVLNDKYKNNGAWDVAKNTLKKPTIPFIKSVKVQLKGFHHLIITVKEKELTGYLRDNKNRYVYVDKNCVVTEIDDRLLGKAIPVSGLKAKKSITVGEKYPAESNRVASLSLIFRSMKNLGLDIDKVTFGSSGQMSLKSGSVTASLGTSDRLKDKLLRLSYILPKIEGKSGTLHFEDYTEDNTDIVFEASTKANK